MTSTSPWDVDNLDDFLHYCCPECDVKNKSKTDFLLHAQYEHPNSMAYLCKYHIKSELEIVDQENGVLEFNESGHETADLYSENELDETYKQEFTIEEGEEDDLDHDDVN